MKSDIAKEKIYPNFQSPQFLREHIEKTFQFYHPRCIDSQGGFYQFFKDNGDIYDDHTRHLVSSTRFVFNMQWLRWNSTSHNTSHKFNTA